MVEPMSTKDGWELLGHIAKERREYLGLRQTEIAKYGGPGKSTVGKIENGRQQAFPPKTLRSLERVYGWDTGAIAAIVAAPSQSWFETFGEEGFAHDYIEAPIPDLDALERAENGRPRQVNGEQQDWPTLYSQALAFPMTVTREVPELRDRATELMVQTGRLFDAIVGLEGGDGHVDDSGDTASMNGLQAVAERDEKDPMEEAEETETDT